MKNASLLWRLVCAALLVLLAAPFASAQGNYQFVRAIGAPANGQIITPRGVAVDSGGNVYVIDQGDSAVQKFDTNGASLLKFGSLGNGDGQLRYPFGIAVDSSGAVYVSDTYNSRVEKFDSSGKFLFGIGAGYQGAAGSPGTYGSGSGQFYEPLGLAVDSSDNLYVMDGDLDGSVSPYANRVQKFDSSGKYLSEFGVYNSDGSGNGIAVDGGENVWVINEANSRILKFDRNGVLLASVSLCLEPQNVSAMFNGIAADKNGNIYVQNKFSGVYPVVKILKFDNNGKFLTSLGQIGRGSGQIASLSGIAVDSSGAIYASDNGNYRMNSPGSSGSYLRVNKLDSNGNYLLKFGDIQQGDGQFNILSGAAIDSRDNVYSWNRNGLQKFDSSGNHAAQFAVSGGAYAIDGNGNIYIADTYNYRVQKFNNAGSFLLRFGSQGIGNGQFGVIKSIATDSSGNVYIIDSSNRAQKFDSAGNFLFGIGGGYNGVPVGATGNSGNAPGQFNNPYAIAVDSRGNIYVVDVGNHRIQKFDSSGNYLLQFAEDAASIAVDGSGNIYVAGGAVDSIRVFDSNGAPLTQFGAFGNGDGQFNESSGVAVDSRGNVWVGDAGNFRLVEFAPANASVSGVLAFQGIAASAAPQNVTFTFRAGDGSADIVQTLAVPASGVFTLPGLFSKAGILHTKPDAYLAVNIPIDLSGGNLPGLNAALLAGDGNNDNSVDSSDFGLLIGAYGSSASVPGSGYDPAADFNGDGAVDSTDFALLLGNFNTVGAP